MMIILQPHPRYPFTQPGSGLVEVAQLLGCGPDGDFSGSASNMGFGCIGLMGLTGFIGFIGFRVYRVYGV